MHLFMYGPPGSGKSTTGNLLAGMLGLPFVDLDQVIESGAGQTIPQIMESGGEESFRALETSALKQVIDGQESVIALGGGTLLRDANRALAEANGLVVCLTANAGTLADRLQADTRPRPLLAGDLHEKLGSLVEKRDAHYRSFPLMVNAEAAPQHVAWQIQIAAGRFHLSAMNPCDVIVQSAGATRLGEMLAVRGMQNLVVVTDDVVARHHSEQTMESLRRAGYKPDLLVIPTGESAKTLETVKLIWDGFLEAGLDRRGTVIALGGGVVSDLAGFAAATFMRGVHWVVVPTTMLSMVDASLGGKTGFDLPEGKNLIGSFHSARLVLADPDLLATLPEAELRSGLAEVLKHGVIADHELFELCSAGLETVKANLSRVIRRAMAVKVKIIEEDPYEKGLRAALNLGHTVGHAVELVSGFTLRHGEAISIGMVAEAKLAERLTVAGPGVSESIAGSLSALGLPVNIPKNLPRAEIIQAMRMDKKKSNGVVRFALPVEIGRVQIGVEVHDLESVLEESE
jgi:shikimate kinase / 3-dehydroquinate synthase